MNVGIARYGIHHLAHETLGGDRKVRFFEEVGPERVQIADRPNPVWEAAADGAVRASCWVGKY